MSSESDIDKLQSAARLLANVACNESRIQLAILRVGLNKLGAERHKELKFVSQQEQQISGHMMSKACGGDAEPPPAYRRRERLFNDLVEIDWATEIVKLGNNCDSLIAIAKSLIGTTERSDRIACGYAYWEWIASVFAVKESGVGPELNLRINVAPPTDELAQLRGVCEQCKFASHVHLIATLLRDYHLTDLSSRQTVRQALVRCFGACIGELRESIKQDVEEIGRVIEAVRRCASSRATLKGGIMTRDAAQLFLGFPHWNEGSFVSLATVSYTQSGQQKDGTRQRNGPRVINYGNDRWASRSVWEAVPDGAFIIPAQGQTRDPRGNRA